jgi:hypothetical protein
MSALTSYPDEGWLTLAHARLHAVAAVKLADHTCRANTLLQVCTANSVYVFRQSQSVEHGCGMQGTVYVLLSYRTVPPAVLALLSRYHDIVSVC